MGERFLAWVPAESCYLRDDEHGICLVDGDVAPVERCKHGNIDRHRTAPPGYQYGNEPEWCPGAGIGGEDAD